MRRDAPGKAQWLLIKHRDEYAAPGSDVTAEHLTSVSTGRTMEEIAGGRGRIWHSNPAGMATLKPVLKRRRSWGARVASSALATSQPAEPAVAGAGTGSPSPWGSRVKRISSTRGRGGRDC